MLIFFSDFVTSFCYLMFFLPFFSYNFSFVVVYKRFIDLIKCYWKSGKLIGLIRREVEKKKKLLNKNNNCFCTCYLSSLDKGKKLNWFLQLICFSSLFSFFFFSFTISDYINCDQWKLLAVWTVSLIMFKNWNVTEFNNWAKFLFSVIACILLLLN